MDPLRRPAVRLHGYGFPRSPRGTTPARRASQVPRPLSRCAPSPTTPGSRVSACACDFLTRAGFTISGRLAAPILAFRGRIEFACATAHSVRLAGLRNVRCRPAPPARLHVPQAFHMVSSFQLTREVRLGLTHRRTRRNGTRRTATSTDSFLLLPGGRERPDKWPVTRDRRIERKNKNRCLARMPPSPRGAQACVQLTHGTKLGYLRVLRVLGAE